MHKIRFLALFLLGGSFFLFDRIFKHLAFTSQEFSKYLINPWLGWEYFANPGVAFGIPLPWFASLISTPIILGFVFWYVQKRGVQNTKILFGVTLIVFGALSNLIDRAVFHITIDYIRLLTAVINLADIMIVLGAICLFYEEWKHKK